MQVTKKIRRVTNLIKKHGVIGFVIKAEEKATEPVNLAYKEQYRRFLPDEEELKVERETAFSYLPKISLVVPAYCTKEQFLCELVESLMNQTYSNWELCIADGSPADEVAWILKRYEADERIRSVKLLENSGISGNTNAAFAMATGDYIGLVDHDDVLAPNALFEVVKTLNGFVYEEQSDEKHLVVSERMPQFLYSDEDKVSADLANYFEPHFKPDYNAELLNHYNYICHFVVFHRNLLEKVGMLNSEYDGAQDYDFVLRCTEVVSAECIYHIPKILYHWRVHEASTAGNSGSKDYAYEAGKRAVAAHLERIGRAAKVDSMKGRETLQVSYELPQNMADPSVDTLFGEEADRENAFIVKQGHGFVNPSKNWQQKMMQYFTNPQASTERTEKIVENYPKVGMVCGKVIRGNKILSCGLTFDEKGNVYPLFNGMLAFFKGYYRRAVAPQNISAGILDFCMIEKNAYQEVGGMDRSLPSPYRDLDFAFRLRKAGYQIIVDPSIQIICPRPQILEEQEAKKARQILRERWNDYLMAGDPCYNVNLALDLEKTYHLKDAQS